MKIGLGRRNDKKYHYLYKITNLLNNKIYVGVHSSNKENDNYMGSGVGIKNAIKKYGVKNFKKEIIEYFENAVDMINREKEIVNEDFVKDEKTYNMTKGGNIPPSCLGRKLSSGHKEILLTALKNLKQSDEAKEKIRKANLGKKKSQSTKNKIGLSNSNKSKPLLSCVICRKTGGSSQIQQWHFDRCKL